MKYPKYIVTPILMFGISFVNLFSQIVEHNNLVPVDESTGLITYQDVVQTEGNKDVLYNRAIGWVNSFYINPADATKVRNPESGIIEIAHRFKITSMDESGVETDAGMILYALKLELRDGRFRYTMNNFVLRQTSRFPVERWLDKSDRAYNPSWEEYLKQIDAFARGLINNLVETMKPEVEVKEEVW